MTPDTNPSVTIVAGEVAHIPGVTGHMLRMRDGQIYVHISPTVAKQWIETLTPIANEGINE